MGNILKTYENGQEKRKEISNLPAAIDEAFAGAKANLGSELVLGPQTYWFDRNGVQHNCDTPKHEWGSWHH